MRLGNLRVLAMGRSGYSRLNDYKYMKVSEGLLCGLNDPVPLVEVSCSAHLGSLLTVCHQRTKPPLRIRRNPVTDKEECA